MAHTPISEGLHEFLTKDSKHYHSVAFASPDAVVFAREVWEAAQRYASEAAIALAAPIDEGIDCHPLRSIYALSSNRVRGPAKMPAFIQGERGEVRIMVCVECGQSGCNGECAGDDMMGSSG
jgi:hypothetical protein